MSSPFIPFHIPDIGEDEIAAVVETLRSGWLTTGPKVKKFEEEFARFVGSDHAVAVNSGTAALHLALDAIGLKEGDEVIVPTMTFVASANAVVHSGATPVLVDCEPSTSLVDLDAVESAITARTRAIMIVHLAGRPVDLDRVNTLRDRRGLLVIEDAAHAIGAEWDRRRIGNHGNLAAFSFYPTKNITTGEGGALATDDPAIAEEVERMALHGLSVGAWQRFSDAGFKHYECVTAGFKFNMTDLQAAIGLHQLPRLDEWMLRRQELWRRYDELLLELPLTLPAPVDKRAVHARHLYQVLVDPDSRVDRDEVLDRLHRAGIGTGVHYRAVHLHPYFRDRYRLRPEQFPVATDISKRTLSLPFSPKVTEQDQEDVVRALRLALAG